MHCVICNVMFSVLYWLNQYFFFLVIGSLWLLLFFWKSSLKYVEKNSVIFYSKTVEVSIMWFQSNCRKRRQDSQRRRKKRRKRQKCTCIHSHFNTFSLLLHLRSIIHLFGNTICTCIGPIHMYKCYHCL